MTAAWASDLVRALSATPTRQAMGAVLARSIPDGLGADAAVVWLPRAEGERPLYSTVFVGGELTCTDDLIEALGGGSLPRWLADNGFAYAWTTNQPSQAVGIALAWRQIGRAHV